MLCTKDGAVVFAKLGETVPVTVEGALVMTVELEDEAAAPDGAPELAL